MREDLAGRKTITNRQLLNMITPNLQPGGREKKLRKSKASPAKRRRNLDKGPVVDKKRTEVTKVPRESKAAAPSSSSITGSYDGNTAYHLYLQEIAKTDLLTLKEENALAARIRKGDAKAREQMIKANLRLVVKIAKEYENYGLPLLDLINEGNIGLMKAVEKFDPRKGAKLSTYGSLWIKQSIRRALANQSKTIRLPVHIVDKIAKMRKIVMHYQEAFSRNPTDEELAEELGLAIHWIAQMRSSSQRPTSLDAPINEDEKASFGEVVADDKMETAYEHLAQKTTVEMLNELVADLDPRESAILRYRFGLDGLDERTLEEVGKEFGVTRERIRQLQNIALIKLRKRLEERQKVFTEAA